MSRVTEYVMHAIVAIRANRKDQANAWWAANIDTDGAGERTFIQALSANGTAPATWYWCNPPLMVAHLQAVKEIIEANPGDARLVIWPTEYGNVDRLLEKFVDNGSTIRVLNSASITPQQVLNQAGLQVIGAGV